MMSGIKRGKLKKGASQVIDEAFHSQLRAQRRRDVKRSADSEATFTSLDGVRVCINNASVEHDGVRVVRTANLQTVSYTDGKVPIFGAIQRLVSREPGRWQVL